MCRAIFMQKNRGDMEAGKKAVDNFTSLAGQHEMVLATTYVCSWVFDMTSNDSLPEGIDAHVHKRPSRL